MTTIAVQKIKNKIILASDTRVSGNNIIVTNHCKKIMKISDTFGLGGAGLYKSLRMMDLFVHLKYFKEPKNELGLIAFYQDYIKFTEDNDVGGETEKDTASSDNTQFIVVMNKGIYIIGGGDFFPISEPFYTIGSGDSIALGVLLHGGTVKEAIEIAMKVDTMTGGTVESFEFNG